MLGAEGYDVGAAEMFRYAAEAEKELERQGLSKLFFEVEQPLVPVLAAMEERGIAVDAAKLDELKIKYEGKLPALAGRRICPQRERRSTSRRPNSWERCSLTASGSNTARKTKTGWSVSEDVLAGLKDEHPVIGLVLEWRHFAKLLGTYVTGMQPLVNRGRIHTEFNQCITATGSFRPSTPICRTSP